jgi:hypothetical protein
LTIRSRWLTRLTVTVGLVIAATAVNAVRTAAPASASPATLGNYSAITNNGRVEVFAINGNDLSMYHNFQTPTGWSGWLPLGRPSEGLWQGAAVVANDDGRLEVFSTGLEGLYHAWQDPIFPSGWSGWAKIADITSPFSPVAAKNHDGRLEVFVGNHDGLWHAWQVTKGGGWSGLALMGKVVMGGLVIGAGPISVAANGDGRLELVALANGNDDARPMVRIWQTTPNGNWSGWVGMAGCRPAGARALQLMTNDDGRLELFALMPFALDANASLCHAWQDSNYSGGWSGWQDLGGTSFDSRGGFAWTKAAGRLVVVARDQNGKFYSTEQVVPNGGWTPVTARSGDGWDHGLAVATNSDQRWEIFASRSSKPYHAWQTSVGGPVGNFVPFEAQ